MFFAPVHKNHCLTCILLLCSLYAGIAGALAAEPAPGADLSPRQESALKAETQAAEDSLMQIWNTRTEELTLLAKEAASLRGNVESLAAPLSESLLAARAQASRLSSLFQALRGHPMEQLTLLRQMIGVQEKLRSDMKPLEDIATTINQRLEDFAALQKDMGELFRDNADETAAAGANLAQARSYSKTLADAKTKLGNASARLEKILAPARTSSGRLDQTIANTQSSLVDIWRLYYLTPSVTDADVFAAIPALLADWTHSISTRLRFAYPQSATDWQEAGKSFALAIAIMSCIGFLALRSAHFLSKGWYSACADIVKGPWVGVGVGFSILSASTNPAGGVYLAFTFAGVVTLIAGVAALSRRLRMTVKPELKGVPSPLNRLLPAAALGVFMLFSDLPPRILSLMWGIIMLVFLARMCLLRRKTPDTPTPLLERLAFSCATWVGALSLLTGLAGYARLAVLLFMALFALINTCTLGNALAALLQNLGDSLFDQEKRPFRHAIAEALTIPAACLLSLLCTLPWLWAVPGAHYLLRNLMDARYTLGDASLNFSRLLFIVVLFFLVRSFVSLINTSLNHLPDHMPHIERGVIPPLRTMIRYLLWALFALIVLGSLGVDFTSLAVVAGGLSVGIGFGVQNLFNNLISGLILIFGRTILVGDFVDVAGISGTVKAINIRSTTIETPEYALVYVPNSSIMSGHFSNWTRRSRMVRRSIQLGVAYGSDTATVTQLLLAAAGKQEHVRKTPPPAVYFTDFGAHALNFTLNVCIDNIDNGAATLSAIRYSIEKTFAERGIEIPFPQLALHMAGEATPSLQAQTAPTTQSMQTGPLPD